MPVKAKAPTTSSRTSRGHYTFEPPDGSQGARQRLHEVSVQRYVVSQQRSDISEFLPQRCHPVGTQRARHADEVLLARCCWCAVVGQAASARHTRAAVHHTSLSRVT